MDSLPKQPLLDLLLVPPLLDFEHGLLHWPH